MNIRVCTYTYIHIYAYHIIHVHVYVYIHRYVIGPISSCLILFYSILVHCSIIL